MTTASLGNDLLSSLTGQSINNNDLVTAMVDAESLGALNLNQFKQDSVALKIDATNQLYMAVDAFKGNLAELADPSFYNTNKLINSSNGEFSITGGEDSNLNLAIQVKQLASSSSFASAKYSSLSSPIGEGAITISAGKYDAGNVFTPTSANTTITVDPSNNTLEGLAETINSQNTGLTANIIKDGDGYRLALTSNETGEDYDFKIEASDLDGNNTDTNGLSNFTFVKGTTENIQQTVTGKNALYSINGVDVSSSQNTIKNAVGDADLTLNFVSDPNTIYSVKNERDTTEIRSSVENLVETYNAIHEVFNYLQTGSSGPSTLNVDDELAASLQGDSTLRLVKSQMQSMLSNAMSDFALYEIGIETTRNGTLEVDSAELSKALEIPGLIESKLARTVTSSNPNFKINNIGEKAADGDYTFSVSSIGEAASQTPSISPSTNIVAPANAFVINVDGVDSNTITIPAHNYPTPQDLAKAIQNAINSDANIQGAGKSMSVTADASGFLTYKSNNVGDTSSFSIVSSTNNFATNLGLPTGFTYSGSNAVVTSPGQVINESGNSFNVFVGGLEGMEGEVTSSSAGQSTTFSIQSGFAHQLQTALTAMLEDKGVIYERLEGLQNSSDTLKEKQSDIESRRVALEEQYRAQFAVMSSIISSFDSTSKYLDSFFNSGDE